MIFNQGAEKIVIGGSYIITKKLGEGSFGVIYEGKTSAKT